MLLKMGNDAGTFQLVTIVLCLLYANMLTPNLFMCITCLYRMHILHINIFIETINIIGFKNRCEYFVAGVELN